LKGQLSVIRLLIVEPSAVGGGPAAVGGALRFRFEVGGIRRREDGRIKTEVRG
jgi:hypothetical protein